MKLSRTYLLALSFLMGCSASNPLPAPNSELPLTVIVPHGKTPEEVQTAILGAFQHRGWSVTSRTPDTVVAILDHHNLVSTATAKYNTDQVTLTFNTTDPKGRPFSTPTTWAQSLRSDINKSLTR